MKENIDTSIKGISRRKFLTTAGGMTMVISAQAMFPPVFYMGKPEHDKDVADNHQVTAWVHLDTNGKITIYAPATEMGQGSGTALPVIVAEEMDADWSKVAIEHSPIEPDVYGHSWGRSRRGGGSMITAGSIAVMGNYHNLRHAGAQARWVLMYNAANKWGVPIEELSTEPGLVVHKSKNLKLSYGEIAGFLTIPSSIPEIPEEKMKNPSEFRLIGNQKMVRRDIPSKTDGSAKFAMDIRLPGMVYGVINRSPVHGAKPTLFNEKVIRNTPGVLDIVMLDHGVGVITDTFEKALRVKYQMLIQWSEGAKAESFNSEEAFTQYAQIAGDETIAGFKHTEKGNVNQLIEASKVYSADYLNDFCYHAQMEPLNAVVSIAQDGQSAEVWVGSQAFDGARNAAAGALGIDRSKVKIHPMLLGGGFGRRTSTDFVVEACKLAMAAKKPLKLIWTREDDLQYGMYRPMSLQRFIAATDASGNLILWKHIVVGQSRNLIASGVAIPHYDIPNQQIIIKDHDHGVRTTYWRAVGHPANIFAIESFIDEVAKSEKVDPVVFRRKLMHKSPRALTVLNKAAEMSNWTEPPKSGRAKGIAYSQRSNSLIAGVFEISLDSTSGKIKVHNVWVAVDAGVIIQPDNAISQMEGGIIMGLSSVMNESITFRDGAVEQSNFDDYPILRMSDAPEAIHVAFIPSEGPPTGIGEAGNPFVGAAVGNAIAALTGKRLRHIPFTPKKILEVLKS